MCMSAKRGQMALIGVAGFLLAIFLLIYFQSSTDKFEKNINKGLTLSEDIKDEIVKESEIIENYIGYSVHAAVEEMATHGGYTMENLPDLKYLAAPYWFYQGKITNIPTIEFMNEMLTEEIERRLDESLNKERSKTKGVSFGYPLVKAQILEDSITVSVNVPVEVSGEKNFAHNKISFEKEYPLRLGYLRNLAERYVKDYKNIRNVEASLFNSIKEDDRVLEPPGRMTQSVSCSNPPFKTRHELEGPIQENAQLAVALEQRRIRQQDKTNQYIEWSLKFNKKHLHFEFDADNKDYGYEKERIYYIPIETPPFSAQSDTCLSFYSVTYDINIPLRVVIRDLKKVSKLTFSQRESTLSSFLEFWFAISPYFSHGNDGSVEVFAVNNSFDNTELVSSKCEGSCNAEISISNSQSGTIWFNNCKYSYLMGKASLEGISCGIKDMIIESSDPINLEKLYLPVTLQDILEAKYKLPDKTSVEGHVKRIEKTYCQNTKEIIEEKPSKVHYIDGKPPAYVKIHLVPIQEKLGRKTTIIDDEGYFSLTHVNPGKYILFSIPSLDDLGHSALKVKPQGKVIDVKEGSNVFDILLDPIKIIRLEEEYYDVSKLKNC